MSAGEPTELSPYDIWQALGDAIRAGAGLDQPPGEPFQGANLPASATHRTFQIDPAAEVPFGRGRPGDILGLKRSAVITLRHDYSPGAHAASYALASHDFERLRDAVLNRPESFRIGQPVLDSVGAPKLVGHTIVQTLTVTVTYQRQQSPLPE